MAGDGFHYDQAFDRNIGWVTESEQQALRGKRIAIAGMGGVGGVHLLTLARMGIGSFSIADMDNFELANFNRQVGASMSSIGRSKAEVMAEQARDINPELELSLFDRGVTDDNIDAFLAGADLFVDGFDFFVPGIRAKVFKRCHELGIPAITAGPIGIGTCYLIFLPGHMSFEEYFRLEGLPLERQYANFLMGLAPKGLHREYLVDPSRLNLAEKRGPSSAAAVHLCAGVVGGEALKILLGRGRVRPAPVYHQFDAYRGKFISRRLPLGNANPLQRLKLRVVEKRIAAALAASQQEALSDRLGPDASEIEKILNLARWAPSGDNSQPWRFEILDDQSVRVHLRAQSDEDVYDYNNGQPTLLSGGMLLETMRIAASAHNRMMWWSYEGGKGLDHRILVELPRTEGITRDPLAACVRSRSVNRGPYARRPLSAADKAALSAALGDNLILRWHEDLGERLGLSRLHGWATDIRLRIPEAFRVHKRVIDWDRDLSPTGIPAKAVGLDAGTLKIMRWGFKDWRRLDRMNRLPAATLAARLQMDYLPALNSAALFTIRSQAPAVASKPDAESLLRSGEALQKFWLTAESLGLALQPALATAIFAHYGRHEIAFTGDPKIRAQAKGLSVALERAGLGGDDLLFLGRIGRAKRKQMTLRSVRRPVSELVFSDEGQSAAQTPSQRAAQAGSVSA